MTLEAPQPNQQNPEGISPQQQERFGRLQTDILGRLKTYPAIVVTSDNMDPINGYYLSLRTDGRWIIGFGRHGGIKFLNEPDKPVEFLKLLKEYAFIQESSRFDAMVCHEPDPNLASKSTSKYLDETIKLEKSVEDNPGPFADSFLRHMEKSLEELSTE